MRADADADAGAETPLESHQPKRPKRCDMIQHDITRAYKQAHQQQHSVPVHSAVLPTSVFLLRMNNHLTSGVVASKTDLTALFCQQAIYERWHYYSISTVGCRVGWCRVRRRRRASMRWQAWQAWRPRACGMRQIRWFMLGCICMRVCHYAYSCMQACWLGDGRLARSVGRPSVKFHL
jgi:hypothetical protein